jgi:hypothetical protein
MTEQRRAAKPLVGLALGLGLLAGALLVVPGSSASPAPLTYEGSGSTTVAISSSLGRPSDSTNAGGDLSSGSTAATDSADKGDPDSSHRPPIPDSAHRFGITVGNVSGLYPGSHNRIPVTFRNPMPVRISVRTATTWATGPADCPVETSLILRTRTFIHRVLIPPHGSRSKTLRFGMRKAAPDGCQNAVFTITVTATAIRA